LWVPWPAGGATDLTMRLLAELAGRRLGHKVMVDNRPGAGGTLAMPILQQAAADGHTLAQLPQPVLRAPHLQRLLWDPIRDTTPIIQLSGVTFGMLVPAASALRSLDDVLDWAHRRPGELRVATNGVGTTPHRVLDTLFSRHGITWVHVPYKGTAEQMIAVSSGQVMVGVNSNGFAPFVDSGQLRLLVTFSEHRTRRWPQVPTLKELGHGIVAMSPYGLAAPRGTPRRCARCCTTPSRPRCSTRPMWPNWPSTTRSLAYLGSDDYGRAMKDSFAAERRVVERMGLAKAQN
jgi:tripartite-type tricarboxylate transporter receptor subunit TctC